MNTKEKELVVIGENSYNLCNGGKGGFDYIRSANLAIGFSLINSDRIKYRGYASFPPGAGEKGGYSSFMKKVGIHSKTWDKGSSFRGKHHTEETKAKMRKSKNKAEKNSQFGTCWVKNASTLEIIKIQKEDAIHYLNQGWTLGRKF